MDKSRISLIINMPADRIQCQLVESYIQNLIHVMEPEQIQIMYSSLTQGFPLDLIHAETFLLYLAYQHFYCFNTPLSAITTSVFHVRRCLSLTDFTSVLTADILEKTFSSCIKDIEESSFSNPYIIDHATRIISQKYAHLSLKELAEQLDINNSYLCRIISKDTGCSFLELLHYRRILAAVKDFSSTPSGHSIENLSFQLGYTSIHHFHRVFKQYTGLTPANAKKLLHEYQIS